MRRLARLVLREPSFWFFVVAASLLALWHAVVPKTHTITIGPDEIGALERSFVAQWGRTPTASEREALLADFLDQELLWREGLRLGLDRGDPIVRRRVVQKMTFLLEASASGPPPTEQQLKDYFELQPERYRLPERVSFQHVFQPRENNEHATSSNVASPTPTLEELRRRLEAGEPPETVSAPFLRGLRWTERTTAEVEATFGPAFLAALRKLPQGTWSEPIPSAFGWHLVRLEEWRPPELPSFDAVRSRVEQDWLDDERSRARAEGLRKLRQRYRVVVEPTVANSAEASVSSSFGVP